MNIIKKNSIILLILLLFVLSNCSFFMDPEEKETNWTKYNVGNIKGSAPKAIEFSQTGQLYVGTDQALNVTNNDGQTFEVIYNNTSIWTLAKSPEGCLIAGVWNGKIYRSQDNGLTWDSPSNIGTLNDLRYDESGNLYAGMSLDGIRMSTDNASTWQLIGYNQGTVNAIYPVSNQTILLSDENRLIQLNPTNQTWNEIHTFANTIYSIFSTQDGNIIVGTLDGIFLSADNGLTWENTLHKFIVMEILETDKSVLYAGTKYGVYRSVDSGYTWKKEDLNGVVADLAISQNGSIFASFTTGMGIEIYKRK